MAFRVKTTTKADRDLDEILTWLLAEGAGQTGLRWFRGLKKAIDSLADLPARCSLAPETATFLFEVRQLLYGHKGSVYRVPSLIADQSALSSLFSYCSVEQARKAQLAFLA